MSDDTDNVERVKACSTCRFRGKEEGDCDWDIPIWMEEFFEEINLRLEGSSFGPAQRAKGYPPLGRPAGWNCKAWREEPTVREKSVGVIQFFSGSQPDSPEDADMSKMLDFVFALEEPTDEP